MAKPPTPPPAPTDDEENSADAPPDEGADAPGSDEDQGQMVCAILCFDDGTYGILKPPPPDETTSSEGEAAAGDEGSPAAPAPEAPEKFPSIGALLKGVMEEVKDFEAQKDGGKTDDQEFEDGYSGN